MALLVFMYHRVLPQAHPEAVECGLFERELDLLQKKFRFLTPSQVEEYLRGKDFPEEKGDFAALTFDDGWADNLFYATGILKERKLTAMMAVSAGFQYEGPLREREEMRVLMRSMRESSEAARFRGDFQSYLSVSELKSLVSSGVWSLEAHGTRHFTGAKGKSVLAAPQGEGASRFEEELKKDILQSREYVDGLTGKKGRIFFWPYGHYSTRGAEIARECGYDIQFSVYKGACRRNDPRLVLPRIGVSRFRKLYKNVLVFGNPLLAAIRKLFPAEQVCFDEFYRDEK